MDKLAANTKCQVHLCLFMSGKILLLTCVKCEVVFTLHVMPEYAFDNKIHQIVDNAIHM